MAKKSNRTTSVVENRKNGRNISRETKFKKDFQWTIPDYFEKTNNIQRVICKEVSPTFKLSRGNEKDPCYFGLEIHPRGDTEFEPNSAGHVSVYLQNQNKFDITVDYKFYIEAKNGSRHFITTAFEGILIKENESNGEPMAMKQSVLEEHKEEFVPNGCLTLGCLVITMVKDVISFRKLNRNLQSKQTMQEELSNRFNVMNPENEENYDHLSDFTIECGDNLEGQFKCHKILLSMRSPVFKSMLSHDTKETRENKVAIPDVAKDVMKNLLNFIYTDSVEDEMISVGLLMAANKYQIERLQAICEHRITADLNLSNIAEIAIASHHLNGSEVFKKEILRFVADHWIAIKFTKASEKLKLYPDLMENIISYLVNESSIVHDSSDSDEDMNFETNDSVTSNPMDFRNDEVVSSSMKR